MIPKNIEMVHIISALNEALETEVPQKRKYYVHAIIYKNAMLPVKYVISLANKYANNKVLDSQLFISSEAVSYLTKMGCELKNLSSKSK